MWPRVAGRAKTNSLRQELSARSTGEMVKRKKGQVARTTGQPAGEGWQPTTKRLGRWFTVQEREVRKNIYTPVAIVAATMPAIEADPDNERIRSPSKTFRGTVTGRAKERSSLLCIPCRPIN